MNIGILKEEARLERRVALTPAAVQSLVRAGCPVYIQKGAGDASHFRDDQYVDVGANLVYTSDEIFGRSDIILKINSPVESECSQLKEFQIVFSFLHLGVAKPGVINSFLKKRICSIGYELIEDGRRNHPILQMMSEIAGRMSSQLAARDLESTNNGRGIVLGGVTGVAPATVVILGAGTVGEAAARSALGAGAEVIVLDKDLGRLRTLETRLNMRVVTGITNEYNVKKALHFADVVIGAVLIEGEPAPHIITEEMVTMMKQGSIIIDMSIDQGGCVETSHPTSLENPTFVRHGVIHYCVPNIPASVARTATFAITNGLLPYLQEIATNGLDKALASNAGLAEGVCTYKGFCTQPAIAHRFELMPASVQSLLNVSGQHAVD